jgi:adenylylsulfate kinase
MKILIMGLSGSGKSTLSKSLKIMLKSCEWFNADVIRNIHGDWDFSNKGRIRQAKRITKLANESLAKYIIADFIAPTKQIRDIFNPDILIWMDTVKSSKYLDTDNMFEPPLIYDLRITERLDTNAKLVYDYIVQNNYK